jgi:hypothetical protein
MDESSYLSLSGYKLQYAKGVAVYAQALKSRLLQPDSSFLIVQQPGSMPSRPQKALALPQRDTTSNVSHAKPRRPLRDVDKPSHQTSPPTPADSPIGLYLNHCNHPTAHPGSSSTSPHRSSDTPTPSLRPGLQNSRMARPVRRNFARRLRRALYP